jgi:hypothetical protein
VEELHHEEAVEVIEVLREVMGLRGLPPEPFAMPYALRSKILEVLAPGEPLPLHEIMARTGRLDKTIVCRDLRKLMHAGHVTRAPQKGSWRLACPGSP